MLEIVYVVIFFTILIFYGYTDFKNDDAVTQIMLILVAFVWPLTLFGLLMMLIIVLPVKLGEYIRNRIHN